MSEYLAMQIVYGRLAYKKVMTKFLNRKDEINEVLIKKGREDLIPKEYKTLKAEVKIEEKEVIEN